MRRTPAIVVAGVLGAVLLMATAAPNANAGAPGLVGGCIDNWAKLGFANRGECISGAAQAGGANSLTWSLAGDYRIYPNQANPNPDAYGNQDVWYFMMADADVIGDPSQYVLLTDFKVNHDYPTDIHQWYNPLGWWDSPTIYFEPEWTGGGLSVLPGNPGQAPEYIIAAWRSPVTGSVTILGYVEDHFPDCEGNPCDGVDWRVSKGSSLIASGSIANGGAQGLSSIRADVVKGDFIFFAVGPQTGHAYDVTQVDFLIFGG